MASARWRKIRRDLAHNKGRTLLVIAAITVGVAASGSILTAYSVITREMDRNYLGTNPPSAILHLESLDSDLVAAVAARPEISAAEARREVRARLVRDPGEWINLQLVVVDDFDDVRVSRFYPEAGASSPASDEILIERSSLAEVEMSVGDDITVTTPGNSPRQLSVAGLVHDPGRTPAWMSGQVVGYITPDGLAILGLEPVLDELRLVAAGDGDQVDNRQIAQALADDLEADGVAVRGIDVPVPGEHPARSVMTTMLFLLQAFGVLALISSGALVATLINAQLKQQSREIGVMKAVGATTGQIAGIYLGTVALLSVAALVIGIPLGILGGRGFIDFTFGLINFEVESYSLDAWVIPLQIAAALGISLLAALSPVLRSSRRSVREAITDHGIAARSSGADPSGGWLGRQRWLGRTTTFGIRNTFRTPSRTMLTVLALSVGGMAFMVALNTGVAWDRAVEAEFEARRYALEVQLDGAYPTRRIERALEDIPQVSAVEAWGQYPAAMQLPEGGRGDAFRLLIPAESTEMIDYPLLEGRWLRPGDKNALVATQLLDPAPTIGTAITIEVDGTNTSGTVVGIVRQLTGGDSGVVYASDRPAGIGADGSANHVLIAGNGEPSVLSAVEERLTQSGIGILNIATAAEGREALDDHLLIIVGVLMLMAILISIVGGLGLVAAMSISVLERRRELGVMRAVGASSGRVLQVVIVEGALIATLSWAVALLMSIPVTVLVENITGQMFVETPLPTSFSPLGVGLWLAIVVLLATGASAIPALETTESPVSQALAYE